MKPHPIQEYFTDGKLDFDLLLSELEAEVENGNINRKDMAALSLFDYTRECQFSGSWNRATRISRGLVLDVVNKKLIALPFEKFFNYGDEHRNHGLPIGEPRWKGATVLEKMDGSCGIAFYYADEWHVVTRGSFESDQAQWATKWLRENIRTENMDVTKTYVFEIIY